MASVLKKVKPTPYQIKFVINKAYDAIRLKMNQELNASKSKIAANLISLRCQRLENILNDPKKFKISNNKITILNNGEDVLIDNYQSRSIIIQAPDFLLQETTYVNLNGSGLEISRKNIPLFNTLVDNVEALHTTLVLGNLDEAGEKLEAVLKFIAEAKFGEEEKTVVKVASKKVKSK